MSLFRFSWLDVGFTVLGLGTLLLDIVLDVRTAVELYQDGDITRLSLLVLLLVSSSLLVQLYSWLWYSYDGFHRVTKVEQALSLRTLRILHCLQLGTYLRHLGVLELAVGHVFCGTDQRDLSVFISHDVAMLRLVEAFSESLPQLVLMVSTSIHRGELHLWPGLKAAASALCVSFTVLSYHRSLRSFLPDKQKQSVLSSLVFLVWNLLLLVSRVSALSLFMSSWPCLFLVHVLCSWLVLSGCAWCCRTAFMASPGGELLYRGTVGLIWYFTWFNVVEGKTLLWTAVYHVYQLLDITLLCSAWFWTRELHLHDLWLSLAVLVTYIVGLMVKGLYYQCLHPNLRVLQDQLDSEDQVDSGLRTRAELGDQVDSGLRTRAELGDQVDSGLRTRAELGDQVDSGLRTRAELGDQVDSGLRTWAELGDQVDSGLRTWAELGDQVDSGLRTWAELGDQVDSGLRTRTMNHRMRKLARNFYS